MAIGGRNMLGAGVDPRLFSYDFSGAYKIGENYAKGIESIGKSVSKSIEGFQEKKKEQATNERKIKKTDNVAKAIADLVPELAPTIEDQRTQMMDLNLPQNDRLAIAEGIGDILNIGLAQIKSGQERASRNQELAMRMQEQQMKPPSIQEVAVPGGVQQMQYDPESKSFAPIRVSGSSQGLLEANLLPEAMKFLADDFNKAGEKYGVDPKILAAIAMHETANGTSNAFRNKNNAMGVSDASGPMQMGSHAESIDRMARLLSQGQQNKGPYAGRKTIAEIADVYAPVGAGNDPGNLNKFWTQGVSRNIERLGGVPSAQIGFTQTRTGFTPTKTTGEEKGRWGQNVQSGGLWGQQNSATGEFKPYPGQTGGRAIRVNPETGEVEVIEGAAARGQAAAGGIKLSPGETLVDDPTSPTGTRIVPIPGGEAERQQAEKQATEVAARQAAVESATAVMSELDRFIAATDKMSRLPLSSVARKGMATAGFEQQAEVENMLTTIRANLQFEQIAKMKEASPTGSTGLGAVTKPEFDALGATLGQLSQVGDPDVQKERALALRKKFLDTIHGNQAHRDKLLKEGRVTLDQYNAIQSLYGGPQASTPVENADRQQRIEEIRRRLRR